MLFFSPSLQPTACFNFLLVLFFSSYPIQCALGYSQISASRGPHNHNGNHVNFPRHPPGPPNVIDYHLVHWYTALRGAISDPAKVASNRMAHPPQMGPTVITIVLRRYKDMDGIAKSRRYIKSLAYPLIRYRPVDSFSANWQRFKGSWSTTSHRDTVAKGRAQGEASDKSTHYSAGDAVLRRAGRCWLGPKISDLTRVSCIFCTHS